MFESPISNNKENKNVAPSPPLDAPGQKVFFWISEINMEILILDAEFKQNL